MLKTSNSSTLMLTPTCMSLFNSRYLSQLMPRINDLVSLNYFCIRKKLDEQVLLKKVSTLEVAGIELRTSRSRANGATKKALKKKS